MWILNYSWNASEWFGLSWSASFCTSRPRNKLFVRDMVTFWLICWAPSHADKLFRGFPHHLAHSGCIHAAHPLFVPSLLFPIDGSSSFKHLEGVWFVSSQVRSEDSWFRAASQCYFLLLYLYTCNSWKTASSTAWPLWFSIFFCVCCPPFLRKNEKQTKITKQIIQVPFFLRPNNFHDRCANWGRGLCILFIRTRSSTTFLTKMFQYHEIYEMAQDGSSATWRPFENVVFLDQMRLRSQMTWKVRRGGHPSFQHCWFIMPKHNAL